MQASRSSESARTPHASVEQALVVTPPLISTAAPAKAPEPPVAPVEVQTRLAPVARPTEVMRPEAVEASPPPIDRADLRPHSPPPDAEAIAELARTADPHEIKPFLVLPCTADVAKSIEPYSEAADLGSIAARKRLAKLKAEQAPESSPSARQP